MGKLITVSFLFAFISCSLQKHSDNDQQQLICELIQRDTPGDAVFLVKKVLPATKALDVYQYAYEMRTEKDYLSRKAKATNGSYAVTEWPFDGSEIAKLRKRNYSDTIWDPREFEICPNLTLLPLAKLQDSRFTDQYLGETTLAYRISEPIYNGTRDGVLLYYESVEMGSTSTVRHQAVFMKKTSGRWEVDVIYSDGKYY